MGPGREPKLCDNSELVSEFEVACRAGDYEFSDEYKAEIIRRLDARDKMYKVICLDADFHELTTFKSGLTLVEAERWVEKLKYTQAYLEAE